MKPPYSVIGIDFGTSTTVVRVLHYKEDGPDPQAAFVTDIDDRTDFIPTLVLERDVDGQTIWDSGIEANNIAKQCKNRDVENFSLYSNFKVDLVSNDKAKKEKAEKLTGKFFEFIVKRILTLKRSGKLTLLENVKVCVSVPSKWPMDAREFMRDVVVKATKIVFDKEQEHITIGSVTIVSEPEAAAKMTLLSPKGRELIKGAGKGTVNVLVLDMGAGTTDLSIFKLELTKCSQFKAFDVLSYPPADSDLWCGGGEIDKCLLKEVMCRGVKVKPERAIQKLNAIKLMKETGLSPVLRDNTSTFCISDQDGFETYQGEELDRVRFEKLTRELWGRLHKLIKEACDTYNKKHNVGPADIDFVILTGGHSNWYCVEEFFKGQPLAGWSSLGFKKIEKDANRILFDVNRSATVAEGLVRNDLTCEFGGAAGDQFARNVVPYGCKFERTAENQYWMRVIIGNKASDYVELCGVGDKLPKDCNKKLHLKVTASILRFGFHVAVEIAYGSNKEKLMLCRRIDGKISASDLFARYFAALFTLGLAKDDYAFDVLAKIEIDEDLQITGGGKVLSYTVKESGERFDQQKTVTFSL